MGFVEDVHKLAGNLGQEAARQAGIAAGETWKYGSAFSQEVAVRASPVVADVIEQFGKLSKEAGKRAAPIASSASRHGIILAQAAFDSGKQGLHAIPQVRNEYTNQKFDWSFIAEFSEDTAKHLGSTTSDFWDKLSSGDVVHNIGQATLPKIEFTQENLSGFSERIKALILANPPPCFCASLRVRLSLLVHHCCWDLSASHPLGLLVVPWPPDTKRALHPSLQEVHSPSSLVPQWEDTGLWLSRRLP